MEITQKFTDGTGISWPCERLADQIWETIQSLSMLDDTWHIVECLPQGNDWLVLYSA